MSDGWLWISCVSMVDRWLDRFFSPFYRGSIPVLSTGSPLLESSLSTVFHQFTGPSDTSFSLICYDKREERDAP
jgi:hypothetical protein